MLTLGRALARRPRLLLLDELSLGLAPVIVERILPVVTTYAKESGCAVLLVEQHIHITLEVADHGYVLSHGELVVHEPVETLRADHQLILSSYLGEQETTAKGPLSPQRTSDQALRSTALMRTGATVSTTRRPSGPSMARRSAPPYLAPRRPANA